MAATTDLPLTSSDLHLIAEALEILESVEDTVLANPVIGRIEVLRPDVGSGDDIVGYFAPYDDWYGFVPESPK